MLTAATTSVVGGAIWLAADVSRMDGRPLPTGRLIPVDPQRTGELTVTVLEAGGESMRDARVTARWIGVIPGDRELVPESEARVSRSTSALGVVHFDRLRPGVYDVWCDERDRGVGVAVVAVDGWYPASITMRTR